MVIGYTTGVYDLFHIGHLNLLKNAKGMCDKLVVGVTVDELVAYKGKQAMIPFEDRIAGASEKLVLKYSPNWSGAGETRHPIWIPDVTYKYFEMEEHEEYDIMVPFTRESWHGRMKACRGVGASLSKEELSQWEYEHRKLLDEIAPEQFEVRHYAALALLRKRS